MSQEVQHSKKRITNCLHGDTPILLYNGKVKPLKDIVTGDEIYGVEEVGRQYNYGKSTVIENNRTKKKSYIITLTNDREIICSGEQQWLSSHGWTRTMKQNGRCVLRIDQTLKGFLSFPTERILQELGGFDGVTAKGSKHLRVKSIKPHMGEQTLYGLVTTTNTFVAHGVIGHTC